MLSDDEFLSLPKEPKLAFLRYVEKLKAELAEASSNNRFDAEKEFASCVKAFTDNYDLGMKFGSPPSDYDQFDEYFNFFMSELTYLITSLKLQSFHADAARGLPEFSLEADYRDQIHSHLDRVRKIVRAVDIEERLKENILKKINALAAEVDKGRSGLSRLAEAMIELCSAAGDAADKLEPAIKAFERLAGAVGKAKKESDLKRLERGEEQKMLEGPTESNPKEGTKTGDDEVPF